MKLIKLAALAIIGATVGISAYAQNYLLIVDVSNATNVTVTTTGNFASTNDASTTDMDGADLLNFFTATNNFLSSPISGTLIGGGTGTPYDDAYIDDQSGVFIDLNVYHQSETATQTFSTTAPAFTGSMGIDLSSVADSLPAPGTSGDIIAGFSVHPGMVIGQWLVISTTPTPEPSTLALASVGGVSALFLAWRRRK